MSASLTITIPAGSTTAMAVNQAIPALNGYLTLTTNTVPLKGQRTLILFTPTDDVSACSFTFVGIDGYGNAVTDTIAGPNSSGTANTYTETANQYASLTSVQCTDPGEGIGTISVGTGRSATTAWKNLTNTLDTFQISGELIFGGAAAAQTAQVSVTLDNIFNAIQPDGFVAHDDLTDAALSGITANTLFSIIYAVSGISISTVFTQTDNTSADLANTLQLTYIQQGITSGG